MWLSYAMIKIPANPWELESGDWKRVENTPEYVEVLRIAPQEYVEEYLSWVRLSRCSFPAHLPITRTQVFPAFQAEPLRRLYQGEAMKSLVSPVHFWFFMVCLRTPIERPHFRTSTYSLFRHPLFFVADYTGPLPLVVPEYFFRGDATFDGLGDPMAASYCIFPYFGQRLFEYAESSATQPSAGMFATFYTARETVWRVPAGSAVEGTFNNPHPVLKRHWRWEEVLEMLWASRMPGNGNGLRPRRCQSAPSRYHEDGQVMAYLECFAQMARDWMERRPANPGA